MRACLCRRPHFPASLPLAALRTCWRLTPGHSMRPKGAAHTHRGPGAQRPDLRPACSHWGFQCLCPPPGLPRTQDTGLKCESGSPAYRGQAGPPVALSQHANSQQQPAGAPESARPASLHPGHLGPCACTRGHTKDRDLRPPAEGHRREGGLRTPQLQPTHGPGGTARKPG